MAIVQNAIFPRYLVERMKGLELYDLWLRAGHRHPASWLEFLCEGEGVFGDCIQETFHPAHWPGAYKAGGGRDTKHSTSFSFNIIKFEGTYIVL